MPPVTHYFGQRHNIAGIFWTTTKIDASWGALRQKFHDDSHEHQDGRAGERGGTSRLRMGGDRAALMAKRAVPLRDAARARRSCQKSKKKRFGENSGGYDTNPMTHLDAGQPRSLMLAEDVEHPDLWRVEWFDSAGLVYITVFAGPSAGERARDYHDAIRDGRLPTHVTDGQQRNAGQSGSS
jgi:hypothetical protein